MPEKGGASDVKFMFDYSHHEEDDHLFERDLPFVAILEPSEDSKNPKRFVMKDYPEELKVSQFVRLYFDGELPRRLKS
jgi:hypothetical protein